MDANELRIGNLVFDDYTMKNKYISGVFNNEIWLSSDNEETDQRSIIDCINPIPLTEKWLTDFGALIYNEYVYIIGLISPIDLIYNSKKKIFYLDVNGLDTEYNIEHVHQLQNLYHALTGNELKLKQKSHPIE